jgi:leucyl-tRNA synthetase
MKKYNHKSVEDRWQKYWAKERLYEVDTKNPDPNKQKFYNLVMFPYPSGDKLHIGHWFNYSGTDIYGRFKRLNGYEVMQPIGFDSFGLPAENYAIKTGVPPEESTVENIKKMRSQLKAIGAMWDWGHEVVTSSPEYYKWTQWLFSVLYKNGFASQNEAYVNWDPVDQTVLANEQVLPDGTAERSGAMVEKKLLKQWFFKITDYAEKLLDHSSLDWPEKTILMQKNWIGKSVGTEIHFKIEGLSEKITVYTTRPDTLFGCSYVVLAPEHKLVSEVTTDEHKRNVEMYLKEASFKNDIERSAEGRDKTGVFTGAFAINPINGRKVPIWVADYVIGTYGTGAVMAVPAHDQRDFEFAKNYNLPIEMVVQNPQENLPESLEEAFTELGILVNSEEFSGLSSEEAKKAITEKLEKNNDGNFKTNYRLHDWLISRQRYWGAPIPIVYDPDGKPHLVPEEYLPWKLPTDVEFRPNGASPLASSKEFIRRTEKIFGKGWRPEFDTMDTFVCSSWYYLRYISSKEENAPFCIETANKWMPVDMYIGGPEHACMHLLYARFINMVLHDLGYTKQKEPFKRLVHQGLITKDGAKMSKSKGNVVSPDEFIEKYGSDVFRMYLMFTGPFTEGGDWNDKGITGIVRFRERFFGIMQDSKVVSAEIVSEYETKLHQTIKKVTEDLNNFQFNTAIAALMEFLNFVVKNGITQEGRETLAVLIAPLAPHLAEECWQKILGNASSVFNLEWPKYNVKKIVLDMLEIAVQVNGKLRGTFSVSRETEEAIIYDMASELENVKKYLAEGKILKTIYVPGKLVNFVVK